MNYAKKCYEKPETDDEQLEFMCLILCVLQHIRICRNI
jgi:hypothetical protein